MAGKVLQETKSPSDIIPLKKNFNEKNTASSRRPRRRKIWKRISYGLLAILAGSILILSYIFPVFEKSAGIAALIMVIRSVVIMSFWYFIIGPAIMNKLKAFLAKKESQYHSEVRQIMHMLPFIRQIVAQSWKNSAGLNPAKRINRFLEILIFHILTAEL